MSKHLVKGHIWNAIEGRMSIFERYFGTFEEAKDFAENEPYHLFKIFDDQEQLVHSGSNVEQSTYA
jgi:hypothetical protein